MTMFSRRLAGGRAPQPARNGQLKSASKLSRAQRAWPRRGLTALTVLAAIGALLCCAPAAFAHAQLLGTSPQSGTALQAQPSRVIFKFNEAVGGTLGAVRVYDAQGNEVDDLH